MVLELLEEVDGFEAVETVFVEVGVAIEVMIEVMIMA
jgi:hypothetical protein